MKRSYKLFNSIILLLKSLDKKEDFNFWHTL